MTTVSSSSQADCVKVKQPFEIPHEGNELTRAARRKIDDDIRELKRRIQSLRTKRNELSPISVLPPEVLSKIFILVRDLPVHDPSIGAQLRNRHTHWIRVGHVCHHWRETALNHPSLWSVPVFTRPNLALEMLRRSKMAPLTIRSTEGAWIPGVVEGVKNALAQITRIQSIQLTLEDHPTLFSLFLQPTPLLESLSLSGPAKFSLPMDALSDAPRLRSLDFNCLDFSWESAIFKHRSLTHLQLRNGLTGASTITQMMDTLHHLPNLRILALNNSNPPHTTSIGNEKTIEFKFLERLELSAGAVDCIFLLRRIRYPSHAMVTLRSYSTKVEDGITICSLIGQNLRHAQSIEVGIHHSPVVIRSARLTSRSNTIEIAFFNKTDNMKKLYLSPDPIIQIHLGNLNFTQTQGRLLTSINNSFNLSSLESLLLDWSFTNDHVRAIRDSLGKLPKLKIINISQSLPEVCIAIAGSPRDEKPKNKRTSNHPQRRTSQHSLPPVTIFPALRILIVEGRDFRRRQYPEMMERLIDMLITRSNINVPIDNLSLERCPELRAWQTRLLGELVVNLEVRGKVVDVRELDSGDDWSGDEDDSDEDDSDEDEYF